MIADVLVPQGTWGGRNRRPIFSYLVPSALASLLQPGQLVAVPFGARLTQGIVWRIDQAGEPILSASPQPEKPAGQATPVNRRPVSMPATNRTLWILIDTPPF